MFARRSLLLPVLLGVWLLTGGADGARGRYLLHFLAVSCVRGPCPDWFVIDRQTGERFHAVVDFSGIATRPSPFASDLLAEGERRREVYPGGGGGYDLFILTAIVGTVPVAPGARPPK